MLYITFPYDGVNDRNDNIELLDSLESLTHRFWLVALTTSSRSKPVLMVRKLKWSMGVIF